MARHILPLPPNGYAQAPLIFTKLLRLPFGSLWSQAHFSVVYMDDSYLQGDSVSSCRWNINATVSLLQAFGFNINERKSVLTPTQSLEFLGFIINSTDMTITLTPRWKSNIAEKLENAALHDELFICYRKPHGPASKDTFARWVNVRIWTAEDKQ